MFSDITQLNEPHQRLRQLTHQLGACKEQEVNAFYTRLLERMEQAFGIEQRLMEKHEFPVARSHLEQHSRVLCAMHKAHCAIMRGDHGIARHIGAKLVPDWFELHNATMDAALVLWIGCRLSPTPLGLNHSDACADPGIEHPWPPSTSAHWRGPERRARPRLSFGGA